MNVNQYGERNIAVGDNATYIEENSKIQINVNIDNSISNFLDLKETQYNQYITNIYNELDKIEVPSKEIYEKKLDNWLTGWRKLDENSRKYLISGEYIYEMLNKAKDIEDYSPFILQFCRILENQVGIVYKEFAKYYDIEAKGKSVLLIQEMKNKINDTSQNGNFNQLQYFIEDRDNHGKPHREKISFGSQILVLILLAKTQKLDCELNKLFKSSIEKNLDEKSIMKEDYMNKIKEIQKHYRNGSAHANFFNQKEANSFRELMTKEILPVWVYGLRG